MKTKRLSTPMKFCAAARFPRAALDQVAGCLQSKGKSKTIAQMRTAIGREVIRRHDRGRN